MATKKKRKPYEERSDIERLESSWKKLNGLMDRDEWSAAIIRAATAAEIAANIAVRHELQENRGLEKDFVDHLLRWANGLTGKLDKLLRPLHTNKEKKKVFNSLTKKASSLNEQRNKIVHSGFFASKRTAESSIKNASGFIETLVGTYHHGYTLPPLPQTSSNKNGK